MKEAVQRGVQAILAGELKKSSRDLVTETVSFSVLLPNDAPMRFSPSMSTAHDALRREHAPVHPRNAALPLGRASRRTVEPRSNSVEHTGGHWRPSGTLVTTPVPREATTLTVNVTGSLPLGNGDIGCQSTGASANEAFTPET